MNMGAHVWTLICSVVIFVFALLCWFFDFQNLESTDLNMNLNDATRTSMYLASDSSARAERGAYIIDKPKFEDYLNEIHIKNLGNRQLTSNDYKVYYLKDDTHPKVAHDDNSNYEAIRGLRVVVNYGHPSFIKSQYKFNDYDSHGHQKTQNGVSPAEQQRLDKYTATEIVQTNDKQGGSNNHHYNDLTM